MNKLKEAENGETAIEIMNLALSLDDLHKSYRYIEFQDKINIAIEIIKLYETREIRMGLIEIDNSLVEIEDSINILIFNQK
jgi:hypothetical protein